MDRCLLSLALFLTAALPITIASAETTCTAEVGYQWKKEGGQDLLKGPGKQVQAKGADEAAAKAALTAAAGPEKGQALEECRKEHENLSACIITKMAGAAGVLHSMGFSSRKALEEAIAADCKGATGTCQDPFMSEPICAAAASSAGEEPSPKEEKSKKKK